MNETLRSLKIATYSLSAGWLAVLSLVALFTLAASSPRVFGQKTIIYVSQSGSQGSLGVSWQDAVNSIEQAIVVAKSGDEIWVAGGNFALSQSSPNGLVLKEGVAMYGGFAGTETTLAGRNLTLSGNTSTIQASGKVYTIFNSQNNLTAATILDGFTITGGGKAGILNSSSSPTFSNLIVTGNGNGSTPEGGIVNIQSSSRFVNVMVNNNGGEAGIFNRGSSTVFVNCLLYGNRSVQGQVTNESSSPVFINCTITDEQEAQPFQGSGIYSSGTGSLKIYNSIVTGSLNAITGFIEAEIQNSLVFSRISLSGSSLFATNPLNSIFVDPGNGDYTQIPCSPGINGGSNAFYASDRIPNISSVTTDLIGNPRFFQGTVDIGAYEYQVDKLPAPANVWYVKAGSFGPGFGWDCASGDLQNVIDNAQSGDQIWVAEGTYGTLFGDFVMKEGVKIYGSFDGTELSFAERKLVPGRSRLQKINGTIVSNVNTNLTSAAVLDGFTLEGGNNGIINSSASPTLANLIITGISDFGISNINSSPVITNCAIVNYAGQSAPMIGIANTTASPVITNCTIAGNTDNFGQGGGIFNTLSSAPKLRNSIVYGNAAGVNNDGTSSMVIENSLVQGSQQASDPLFVDANNGDYSLQPCSPAVNKGFNYFKLGQTPDLTAYTTDLSDVPLLSESAVDLGAFQFSGANRELAANLDAGSGTVIGDFTLTTAQCKLIAGLSPNGAAPLNGAISARVWIAGTQPANFVKRHYQITPNTNSINATAKVTLYFTQQEFDDFNAVNTLKLPLNAADAENFKVNLRIEKRSGASNDGSGLPNSYSGTTSTFKPSEANGSIVWNALADHWEVSFNVTGFSGFFVKTTDTPLPLNLLSLTAAQEAGSNLLTWNTASEVNTDYFEIQHSADAKRFVKLATVNAGGSGNHVYSYLDQNQYNAAVYYRLKMTDRDGSFTYSKIILLPGNNSAFASLYPNPAGATVTFVVNNSLLNTTATLHDISGREVRSVVVKMGRQEMDIKSLASGVYILKFADGSVERFVKE